MFKLNIYRHTVFIFLLIVYSGAITANHVSKSSKNVNETIAVNNDSFKMNKETKKRVGTIFTLLTDEKKKNIAQAIELLKDDNDKINWQAIFNIKYYKDSSEHVETLAYIILCDCVYQFHENRNQVIEFIKEFHKRGDAFAEIRKLPIREKFYHFTRFFDKKNYNSDPDEVIKEIFNLFKFTSTEIDTIFSSPKKYFFYHKDEDSVIQILIFILQITETKITSHIREWFAENACLLNKLPQDEQSNNNLEARLNLLYEENRVLKEENQKLRLQLKNNNSNF